MDSFMLCFHVRLLFLLGFLHFLLRLVYPVTTFFNTFSFFFMIYFNCVFLCVLAWAHGCGSSWRPPELELEVAVNCPLWVLEARLCPLRKQCVLLTAEAHSSLSYRISMHGWSTPYSPPLPCFLPLRIFSVLLSIALCSTFKSSWPFSF